jgi:hypothetical protein
MRRIALLILLNFRFGDDILRNLVEIRHSAALTNTITHAA